MVMEIIPVVISLVRAQVVGVRTGLRKWGNPHQRSVLLVSRNVDVITGSHQYSTASPRSSDTSVYVMVVDFVTVTVALKPNFPPSFSSPIEKLVPSVDDTDLVVDMVAPGSYSKTPIFHISPCLLKFH